MPGQQELSTALPACLGETWAQQEVYLGPGLKRAVRLHLPAGPHPALPQGIFCRRQTDRLIDRQTAVNTMV